MQTSQIKTIISATGLMLLGALGMHAQSIIAPPRSPNAHQMAANTRRPSPKPTVMPANEMYVKGHEYHQAAAGRQSRTVRRTGSQDYAGHFRQTVKEKGET